MQLKCSGLGGHGHTGLVGHISLIGLAGCDGLIGHTSPVGLIKLVELIGSVSHIISLGGTICIVNYNGLINLLASLNQWLVGHCIIGLVNFLLVLSNHWLIGLLDFIGHNCLIGFINLGISFIGFGFIRLYLRACFPTACSPTARLVRQSLWQDVTFLGIQC